MARRADKVLTVLYVGDRDPSGMHMSEVDLPRRLERYGAHDFDIEIVRVAIIEGDTLPATGVPSFHAADKTNDQHDWYVEQ